MGLVLPGPQKLGGQLPLAGLWFYPISAPPRIQLGGHENTLRVFHGKLIPFYSKPCLITSIFKKLKSIFLSI